MVILLGDGPDGIRLAAQIHVFEDGLEASAVLHADNDRAGVFDQLEHPFGAMHQRDAGEQHTDGGLVLRVACCVTGDWQLITDD